MAKKLSPFEKAFKEARAEGEKTFTFNGKSYGTGTLDERVKQKVDTLPSMSRTQGETKFTQGATYPKPAAPTPKPKAEEKSLLDTYRESDIAKGFRDARATFGDTPSTDMLMKAGQIGIGMEGGKLIGPAGRAVGAVVKRALKEDVPESFLAKEKNQSFNPEKMVDRSRSDPAFNLEKMAGRERPEPNFKKGGKVSSASSRGDGIAQRGKTKGRMR